MVTAKEAAHLSAIGAVVGADGVWSVSIGWGLVRFTKERPGWWRATAAIIDPDLFGVGRSPARAMLRLLQWIDARAATYAEASARIRAVQERAK